MAIFTRHAYSYLRIIYHTKMITFKIAFPVFVCFQVTSVNSGVLTVSWDLCSAR